jgi:DNA repair protein RadC
MAYSRTDKSKTQLKKRNPEELPNAYQLRERFMTDHSFEGFEEKEVLSMLLSYSNGSVNPSCLADRLLDSFGSLKAVFEARPEQLMKVEGMTHTKASLVSMAIPLTRAWIKAANENPDTVIGSKEASEYCRSLLIGERLEKMYVIALNVRYRVVGKRCISTGTISEVNTYPRLVMETALNYNAAFIILSHNHPGGANYPSEQDIRSTRKLQCILKTVGITLLDHIIVAGNNTYSMLGNRDINLSADYSSKERKNHKARKASAPREKNNACHRSKKKEESDMPYDKKVFGIVISKLRVEKGLTQERLSGLAGISRSHLVALENGEKTVKLDTLWRIAEALEIEPSELIKRIERKNN